MKPTPLAALLWDLDGTLADTERDGHLVAFNRAFEACGVPWRWDDERYGALLAISGGRERLLHDMDARSDAPVLPGEREALAREVHRRKNELYAEIVRAGGVKLREGVRELMDECRAQGVRMALATTTSRSNAQALLQAQLGPHWSEWFGATVCGEDVRHKKPDPEVFNLALQKLGLPPLQAVALEDSPGGVAAARAAFVPVVVTRSAYFAQATVEGAIAIGPGLGQRQGWRPAPAGVGGSATRIGLADLRAWHQAMELVSDCG